MTRRTGSHALVAVTLLLGSFLVVPVAQAEPTDDDVRRAQDAVRSTAATIAGLEVEMAAQAARLDDAWTEVAVANEDYGAAVVAADEAAAAATAAAQRHAAAQLEVEAARAELGTIAQQAYRGGGAMDTVGAMFSADGFEDLVQRSQVVDRLGTQADRAVQRFSAADLVASTLAGLAEAAADEATEAAEAAEGRLADAEAAKAAAEQEVADATARREALVVELAALRQTSVEVERARQAGLDEERRQREEAAAAGSRGGTRGDTATGGSGGAGSGGAGSGGATTPPPTTPPPTNPTPSNPTPPPATPTPPPPAPTPPPTTPPPPPPTDRYGLGTGSARGSAGQGQAAVAWALQQVGKPYGWGASGPDSFDCSGLTSQAWRAAGLSLTRTSRSQFIEVRKIAYGDMRPGDLIFYGSNTADPQSIHHVAMYVGGGQMVEAPRPGVSVRVTAVRWSGTMLYAGRP